MPRFWYAVSHTGEVDCYTEAEGITDFPRGVLLAYQDCCLTTGLKSKEEALEAIKKYPCDKFPKGAKE